MEQVYRNRALIVYADGSRDFIDTVTTSQEESLAKHEAYVALKDTENVASIQIKAEAYTSVAEVVKADMEKPAVETEKLTASGNVVVELCDHFSEGARTGCKLLAEPVTWEQAPIAKEIVDEPITKEGGIIATK